MSSFTAKDVQSLRQATGAGMMDAKKALTENDGDFDAAAKWLREKGLAKAATRTDRENEQGAVAVAREGDAVALVELKSETDFSAKAEDFVSLTTRLAEAVVARGEGAVSELADEVDQLKITKKENIEVGKVVRWDVPEGHAVDSYLHVQDGRGVNAVLVELDGGGQELAHDVAVHIAFTKPSYLTRDDVPSDEVEAERSALTDITRAEGKPEAALEKIVEGRLTGWFKERVLLEQNFVRDEKQTITQLLGGSSIVRFDQVVIGG
ncbi:translation elongation factor Ts [Actinomarinicola tropica]|uniref:Elongation factor Ts n=1 Tax=Actinomarinicola tropica TaxID=2789776 RepID=A0A5Q2RGL4_9ACTN|nr:translation elongation factor Ts [Actinomarinicola tropica]QGG94863.1 translation elongation factor Ts [Actinomarinicola tropica]